MGSASHEPDYYRRVVLGIDTSEGLMANHQAGATYTYAFLGNWAFKDD